MSGMNHFKNSASACCNCGKAADTSARISRIAGTVDLLAVSVFVCLPDSEESGSSYYV